MITLKRLYDPIVPITVEDDHLLDIPLHAYYLGGDTLKGVVLPDEVPVVPHLDRTILHLVESDPHALDMSQWHRCETIHCLAGWAIHLAGDSGTDLEERFGARAAGSLIYHASEGVVPEFFRDNHEALEQLRARVASSDRRSTDEESGDCP